MLCNVMIIFFIAKVIEIPYDMYVRVSIKVNMYVYV